MKKQNPDPSTQPENSSADIAVRKGSSLLPSVLFYEAVEQSSTAISITDEKANILYANPAFSKITGYPIEEVIGQNQSMMTARKTPNSVYEAMWGSLARGNSWCGLLVNRRKDGSDYLAEVTIAPFGHLGGETAHFLGMHRDVTEYHQLQQQVRNQNALIESVIDATPVITLLLDEDLKVVLDNQAFRTLKSSFKNIDTLQGFLGTLQESMGEQFESIRDKRGSFENKEISFDAGGEAGQRWFNCSGVWLEQQNDSQVAFINGGRKLYLLLVASETTMIKQQQEQLRMAALSALMAEGGRVQSMRETLAGAIYQIQQPVNLVGAAAAIVARRHEDFGDSGALLNVLNHALAAGKDTLDTLQKSMPSKPQEARAPVNINHLIREVLSISTNKLLSDGVVVDWQPSAVLPTLLGNEASLRNVIKELVDNAIEAMRQERHGAPELRIFTACRENMIEVVIEDTGSGIPEELHLKVFQPFFSTRQGGSGCGMGLPSSQETVNDHSGSLEIDHSYQDGCRFRLLLPIARRE